MTEAEIKQRLEVIKHQMYMAKREGQVLRLELRLDLIRERARAALAAGVITEADITNARAKWETFKSEVAALKAAGDSATKKERAACTAAWNDLRDTLRAAREKIAKAQAA